MKNCNKCKIDKELTKFGKDKSTKDGYKNKCKDCERKLRGSSKRKNINNLSDANMWLNENYPNFSVIAWGGSEKSIILDKKRDVQFEYSFSRFKDKTVC